jgi:hypothetical protein
MEGFMQQRVRVTPMQFSCAKSFTQERVICGGYEVNVRFLREQGGSRCLS